MSIIKKFERGILMILSCQNICKTFVEKPVLQNISFHLNENDRLAIIGYNGAGKSTLLKILIGEISYDEGEISLKKDASIGYLAQHQDHTFHHTIFDELLSVKKEVIELDEQMRTYEQEMKHLTGDALEQKMKQYTNATHRFEQLNGFAYKSEITGILKGLGFSEEDFTKEINTLSGGQRTRVALGKLLLKNPDILLLDEPTNHLDVDSIRWLENYLSHYKGAVIIVSHDRYFLDKIVNKVMEIDQGHSMLFDGNYTTFIEKRDQIKAIRLKEYKNQQQEIKHQQEVIKKLKQFNREKSIKRAGMDYWDDLDVTRYIDYQDFLEKNPGAKIYMASTKAPQTYTEVQYEEDAYIMFGKESGGIPEEILLENQETAIRIPMMNDIRSLNLSNSVAIVLYEALRQHNFDHMQLGGHLTRYEWK